MHKEDQLHIKTDNEIPTTTKKEKDKPGNYSPVFGKM
jgi:hypothetical protein